MSARSIKSTTSITDVFNKLGKVMEERANSGASILPVPIKAATQPTSTETPTQPTSITDTVNKLGQTPTQPTSTETSTPDTDAQSKAASQLEIVNNLDSLRAAADYDNSIYPSTSESVENAKYGGDISSAYSDNITRLFRNADTEKHSGINKWKTDNSISDFDYTQNMYALQTDPNARNAWIDIYTDPSVKQNYLDQFGSQIDTNGDGDISEAEAGAFWDWNAANTLIDTAAALSERSQNTTGAYNSNAYSYDTLVAQNYALLNEAKNLLNSTSNDGTTTEVTSVDFNNPELISALNETLPSTVSSDGTEYFTRDDWETIKYGSTKDLKEEAAKLTALQLGDLATADTGIKLDDTSAYNTIDDNTSRYRIGETSTGLAYDPKSQTKYTTSAPAAEWSNAYISDYLSGNNDSLYDYLVRQYTQYNPDTQSLYSKGV